MTYYPDTYAGIAIEVGDFVSSRLARTCCGLVQGAATVRLGQRAIPGYTVVLASGRKDFIPADLAHLIAPSEEHFSRLVAAGVFVAPTGQALADQAA